MCCACIQHNDDSQFLFLCSHFLFFFIFYFYFLGFKAYEGISLNFEVGRLSGLKDGFGPKSEDEICSNRNCVIKTGPDYSDYFNLDLNPNIT